MDRIIIINDNGIQKELNDFLTANQNHIMLNSDFDEVSLDGNSMLSEIIQQYEAKHKIKIQSRDNIFFFKSNEIIHIKAKMGQTTIYLNSNKMVEVNEYIDNIEEQLKNFAFLRIHTNHIINVHFIAKIFERDQNTIELIDGTVIPVSEFRKELIKIDEVKNL